MPFDPLTQEVTTLPLPAPAADKDGNVWALLLGGPMGLRTWAGKTLAPGTRIVCTRDGRGSSMKPVVYEIGDEIRDGMMLARYAGFATEADLAAK